jgi:hypothetical protein
MVVEFGDMARGRTSPTVQLSPVVELTQVDFQGLCGGWQSLDDLDKSCCGRFGWVTVEMSKLDLLARNNARLTRNPPRFLRHATKKPQTGLA